MYMVDDFMKTFPKWPGTLPCDVTVVLNILLHFYVSASFLGKVLDLNTNVILFGYWPRSRPAVRRALFACFSFFFCPVVGLQLSLEKLKIIGAASFLTSSCRSFKEGPNKTPYHNMLFKAVFSNMLCTITQILQGQKAIFR